MLFAVLPVAVVAQAWCSTRGPRSPGRRWRAFVRGLAGRTSRSLRSTSSARLATCSSRRREAFRSSGGLGAYAGVRRPTTPSADRGELDARARGRARPRGRDVPRQRADRPPRPRCRPRDEEGAERAFLAVATSAVVLVVVQVAAFASRFSFRIEERYMFFVVPLLFMALALWLDRGLPRPVVTTAVGPPSPCCSCSTCRSRSASTSRSPRTRSASSRCFGSRTTTRFRRALADDRGAAVAALVFALLPRRFARVVLPSALALYLALSTVQVFRTVRDFALNTRAILDPAQLTGSIREPPRGASTGVDLRLDGGSVRRGAADVAGGVLEPRREGRLQPDARAGVVREDADRDRAALRASSCPRVTGRTRTVRIGGERPRSRPARSSGASRPGRCTRSRSPLRLTRVVEGVYPDGWMGTFAALTSTPVRGTALDRDSRARPGAARTSRRRSTIAVGSPVSGGRQG